LRLVEDLAAGQIDRKGRLRRDQGSRAEGLFSRLR
jgi:hypothetical protein